METRNTLVGRIADKTGLNRAFGKRSPISVAPDVDVVVSPVQARVAHIGKIEDGELISKSGKRVSLQSLLGKHTKRFSDGIYFNLYLKPTDKHFWVTPFEGKFTYTQKNDGKAKFPVLIALEGVYSRVPGARRIPIMSQATERNASIGSIFQTKKFPIGMIAVGSLNVNRIEVLYEEEKSYKRGEVCGQFKIGSTMLLCFPKPGKILVKPGQKVQMGSMLMRIP